MTAVALTIIAIAGLAGALYCLWMLYRNEQVHRYRGQLVDKVRYAALVDIARGTEWEWRYDVYDQVSYISMLNQHWKPLDSFYPDKSFIDKDVVHDPRLEISPQQEVSSNPQSKKSPSVRRNGQKGRGGRPRKTPQKSAKK